MLVFETPLVRRVLPYIAFISRNEDQELPLSIIISLPTPEQAEDWYYGMKVGETPEMSNTGVYSAR